VSFYDFARSQGVELSRLYPSDKIIRCGTLEKPRSKNGAYFWDGARGWVMDWSGDARVTWYNDPDAKPWTDQEKRQWALKRHALASEKSKSYAEVAQKALETLKQAKLASHDYMMTKGLDEQVLVLDNVMLVPMRNVATNKIQGYQSITWNPVERSYDKKMLFGMQAKNAVLMLGNRSGEDFWLVEGFATGISLRNALRSCGMLDTVVVCFSASNLLNVSDQIKGNKYVFADHDKSGVGEKTAIDTGLPWVMADEEGWDANDLHYHRGLFAVMSKIMKLKSCCK